MMTKSACVTGTDRGLGLALTAGLLSRGYKVFAGRYLPNDNEALKQLALQYEGMLFTVHMDISQDQSTRAAAEWIKEHTDSIDLLINSAGLLGDMEKTVYDEKLDFQEMLDVYNVNALGPLRVTNALIHLLTKSGDSLIMNISSEAASITDCYRTNWFAYCMSKTAVNMQTALLHNELMPTGTQMMAIHPGWMQTHMKGVLDAAATYTPEQSAEHILKLADNRSEYKSDKPVYMDLLGTPLPW
jgi:NAD(P)-dependent dehydrogenase (short-subunit alcohol dehydrogenase family)